MTDLPELPEAMRTLLNTSHRAKPWMNECGWWVGPVGKLDGETCVCTEPEGHEMPHKCPCGSWFEGCGHPPYRGPIAWPS